MRLSWGCDNWNFLFTGSKRTLLAKGKPSKFVQIQKISKALKIFVNTFIAQGAKNVLICKASLREGW